MTKTVTLIVDALDENRMQRKAGESFLCSDSYAEYLANANIATYPTSNLQEVRLSAGGSAMVSGDGTTINIGNSPKTVLLGDSMVDTYETSFSGITGTYTPATGALSLAVTGHQQAVGWYVVVWNRNYASTLKFFRVPVVTVTDANNIVVNVGANLSGLPASDANWFVRIESWRSGQAFVPWLQCASGQKFNIVYNGAQSGDTTQNTLDRLSRDCFAYTPSVVIMQIPGINDTSSGNGNIKDTTIFANQCSLVDQICATNAILILLSMTPLASGDGRSTLQNMMRVIRLNQQLRDYVKSKPNVIWFDAFRRIVDPANATGLAFANFVRTTDKIHYSMRGGKLIADALWSQISSRFQSDFSTLPTSVIDCFTNSGYALTSVTRSGGIVSATCTAHGISTDETRKVVGGSASFNDYVVVTSTGTNTLTFPLAGADGSITGTITISNSRNLHDYPTLATTSGGTLVAGSGTSTGTAAAGIRVNNTAGTPGCVSSVVSRSDGYGNDQQVVITPASASDVVQISNDFAQYSTQLPSHVLAGRTYVAEFELTMTGVSGSNLTEIRPTVSITVGGTTYIAYALNGYAEGANLNSDVTAAHIRTAPLLLPAGAVTAVQWTLALRFSGAGTALTVKVGRINLTETP